MPMDRAPLKAVLKALVDSLGPEEAIGMKRSLAYLKKQPAYAAVDVAAESALVKELLLEIKAEEDSSSSSSSGSGSTSSSSGSGSGSDDGSDDTSDVAYGGGSDSDSRSGSGEEGEDEDDEDESEEEASAGGKRKAEGEAEGAPSKKKAKKAKKEDKDAAAALKFLDSMGLTSMGTLGERRSAQQAMQRIKGSDKPKPKVTRVWFPTPPPTTLCVCVCVSVCVRLFVHAIGAHYFNYSALATSPAPRTRRYDGGKPFFVKPSTLSLFVHSQLSPYVQTRARFSAFT